MSKHSMAARVALWFALGAVPVGAIAQVVPAQRIPPAPPPEPPRAQPPLPPPVHPPRDLYDGGPPPRHQPGYDAGPR